jgi:hypothetical protein
MSESGIKITVLLSCLVFGCLACGKKADDEASGKATEVKKSVALKQKPAAELTPADKPKPTAESAPAVEPKPTAEPTPAEEPQPKKPSEAKSAPKVIVLDYYKGGKSAVTYTHAAHLKYGGCKTCHHEGMSSCNECHQKTSGETPSLKSVFHDQCKACHKSHAKKNPESQAPTKCTGCHK